MTAPVHGYLRMPAVHGDTVVFVSEDDLWAVSLAGGAARRLTAGRSEHSHPCSKQQPGTNDSNSQRLRRCSTTD